jgi:NADPH-dependent 2,4-dienoyl-CoA reductase/sulfur reductase-like enzyme
MAAAMAAASRGATVVLVDSGARLGGQYFRQALVDLPRAGIGGQGDLLPAGPHLPERWRPLAGHRSVALVLGSDVWSVSKDVERFVLRLAPQGNAGTQGNVGTQANPRAMAYAGTVRSRALVLATGASELTLPFSGWELPGVVTAGAAQSLLKSQGLSIGDRVVVAGTGPFLLPVAVALARAGSTVTVVEAATSRSVPRALPALLGHPAKLAEAAGYASVLARHGVRLLTGRAVVRAAGSLRVERAVTVRLGPDWVPAHGTEQVLEADALCVSYGFVPRLELARQLGASETASPQKPAARIAWGDGMVTSVPGLFVAGELAGVAGADVAEFEGELAGHSAASYLGLSDHRAGRERERHARRLSSARAFARRLEPLYPVGQGWLEWLEAGTLFCRCEEVTWGAVREAIGEGAATVREVRNVTRCGMGYCQGRTCGPSLQLALSALSGRSLEETGDFQKRPVAVPVPLAEVIGDH